MNKLENILELLSNEEEFIITLVSKNQPTTLLFEGTKPSFVKNINMYKRFLKHDVKSLSRDEELPYIDLAIEVRGNEARQVELEQVVLVAWVNLSKEQREKWYNNGTIGFIEETAKIIGFSNEELLNNMSFVESLVEELYI